VIPHRAAALTDVATSTTRRAAE